MTVQGAELILISDRHTDSRTDCSRSNLILIDREISIDISFAMILKSFDL